MRAVGLRDRVEPYVICDVGQTRSKSKVLKGQNPVWDETVEFHGTLGDCAAQGGVSVKLASGEELLGEVQVPLKTVDLNRKSTFVRELGPVTNILSTAKSPSKSSSSRDSSYVEDGRKSPKKAAPGGPSMLRYRIDYDNGARKLRVRVIEARVRPRC